MCLWFCHWVQVGIKSQVAGPTVQLVLFLGNKHSEALQQVVLVAPPSPAFAFQMGPVPQQLEPKKQVGWRACSCWPPCSAWAVCSKSSLALGLQLKRLPSPDRMLLWPSIRMPCRCKFHCRRRAWRPSWLPRRCSWATRYLAQGRC